MNQQLKIVEQMLGRKADRYHYAYKMYFWDDVPVDILKELEKLGIETLLSLPFFETGSVYVEVDHLYRLDNNN